ncbi:MAG: hypothetical protein V1799_08280 [bacterium]
MFPSKKIILLAAAFLGCACSLFAQAQSTIGDVADGNRSIPNHLIKLYDEFDHVIKMDELPAMPFSSKQTCGKCHDYEKIKRGWHFNAADSGIQSGRTGEPWILVDRMAATQIPLSYRGWKGTYQPGSLGLSTFKFLSIFGRHLPGGGIGENEQAQDLNDYMRWQVSGTLDVNCQSCHNADPAQSQAEYGVQVLRQNFRWAAAASSGLTTMQGAAVDMPDNYDLYSAVPPERSNFLPPTIHYTKSRFDISGKTLFNVPRKMPATQCSFCHSDKVIVPEQPDRWEHDEDVHIAAGMTCMDCHRNGIDHQMIRGYEGEAKLIQKPGAAVFTCKGCHLGTNDVPVPREGKRGAPRPQHLGIPPVHFERLSCTACHSGPWPGDDTYRVKTSRAHALGIPKADKSDDALPQIQTPVYAQGEDGIYAPHNIFWPAFWAYKNQHTVLPITPTLVQPLIAELFKKDTTRILGRWPQLRNEDINAILGSLREMDSTAGVPVYISGGTLFRVGTSGALETQDDGAAKPYLWPIAHDVRPKAQSLGIRGCGDCHATDAPFHFGSVSVSSPYVTMRDSVTSMTDYQNKSSFSAWLFSISFLFRPGLKLLIIISFVLLASVVLIYAMRGLAQIIRTLAEEGE